MQSNLETRVVSFSNKTRQDRKLLKKFVDLHWRLYENDSKYIPLLDYEYLGFRLIGIHGFFEPDNLFYKHAEMRFFMAVRNDEIVGRCNAFVNHRHNAHWKDQVGFFGQFESIDDPEVSHLLIESANDWLKNKGMNRIRGPQNLPVNEATPGILTDGFDSRPVMYYHYNMPYYADLLEREGFKIVKRVLSWEYPVKEPFDDKVNRLSQKIIQRYGIRIETWDQRPLRVRKREMLEIYNAAWNDNYGFVPFTEEEFFTIIDDMMLVMDKSLFIFLYIKEDPVAFFGGVPNVVEKLGRIGRCRHCELIRALRMLLGKNRIHGFRLGYLGVKPKYRRLGLDAVMLWKQREYAAPRGYEYCDVGWVLEDNHMAVRMADRMGCILSKTYSIYERTIR